MNMKQEQVYNVFIEIVWKGGRGNMIYYCMAFYPEARPFIRKLKLKKCAAESHFQIFENEDVRLILTGIGEVQAAAAVS